MNELKKFFTNLKIAMTFTRKDKFGKPIFEYVWKDATPSKRREILFLLLAIGELMNKIPAQEFPPSSDDDNEWGKLTNLFYMVRNHIAHHPEKCFNSYSVVMKVYRDKLWKIRYTINGVHQTFQQSIVETFNNLDTLNKWLKK